MRELFSPLVDRVLVLVRSLGPYAAIELLLPGGSMVALLYWWYRQRLSRTRDIPDWVRTSEGGPLSESFFARNPREIEPEISEVVAVARSRPPGVAKSAH